MYDQSKTAQGLNMCLIPLSRTVEKHEKQFTASRSSEAEDLQHYWQKVSTSAGSPLWNVNRADWGINDKVRQWELLGNHSQSFAEMKRRKGKYWHSRVYYVRPPQSDPVRQKADLDLRGKYAIIQTGFSPENRFSFFKFSQVSHQKIHHRLLSCAFSLLQTHVRSRVKGSTHAQTHPQISRFHTFSDFSDVVGIDLTFLIHLPPKSPLLLSACATFGG